MQKGLERIILSKKQHYPGRWEATQASCWHFVLSPAFCWHQPRYRVKEKETCSHGFHLGEVRKGPRISIPRLLFTLSSFLKCECDAETLVNPRRNEISRYIGISIGKSNIVAQICSRPMRIILRVRWGHKQRIIYYELRISQICIQTCIGCIQTPYDMMATVKGIPHQHDLQVTRF